MPSLKKQLLDAAAEVFTKAAEVARRLVRDEDDASVPPPASSPEAPSPAPDELGAPRPGAAGAPKSASARKPKARAKAKPSGRGATAKAGPEPAATAATPAETPV